MLRCFNSGGEYVVAESPVDAEAAWSEVTGAPCDPDEADSWEPIPDDRLITITFEGVGPEPDRTETKTAAEWAQQGRGFLCSENC